MIYIKSAERDKTGDKYFPGSSFKFPVLFNTYTYSIEHKNKKDRSVNRSYRFSQGWVIIDIFGGHRYTYEY